MGLFLTQNLRFRHQRIPFNYNTTFFYIEAITSANLLKWIFSWCYLFLTIGFTQVYIFSLQKEHTTFNKNQNLQANG